MLESGVRLKMQPPIVVKIDYLRNSKYLATKMLQGGMGVVYKLYPVASGGKTVAVKTIKGNNSLESFDIECEAWFSVAHHPNIARPLGFGTLNSLPSVAIEWYPKSLADFLPRKLNGPLVQNLIAGTVNALAFAYTKKRLIHQDIKPANILIDKSGTPKLSDFGIARCVVPSAKERIALGVGNIPKSTSRELSGTPFFMAPELWDGVSPSVRTDIFSVGVTFYNALTKLHPYLDENGHVMTSDLRMEPLLERAAATLGEHGDEIIAFLKGCLTLDPTRRFQTYGEIFETFSWIKPIDGEDRWTLDQSEIVAGAAQLYRSKGETKKAFNVIETVLKHRPRDAVLIEALADLHAAIGDRREAELHYSLAYNNLRENKGVVEGFFVPRPALAWARCLINWGKYNDASDVVREVLGWKSRTQGNEKPIQLVGSGHYSEIGWYFLYKGDFEKAFDELLRYSSRKSLDKVESIWIVEAAWMSGAIKINADEIALKVLENIPDQIQSTGELEHVWARSVLGDFSNKLIGAELWKTNPPYLFMKARELEEASGLAAGSLLQPDNISKQKPLLIVMDTFATGGVHHELIQSVSKI